MSINVFIRPRTIVTETNNAIGDVFGAPVDDGEIIAATSTSSRNTTAFPTSTRCVEIFNYGSAVVYVEVGPAATVEAQTTTSTVIAPKIGPVRLSAGEGQKIAVITD